MYQETPISVTHHAGQPPTIQIHDTGPLSLGDALSLADRIRLLVRIGVATEALLLVVIVEAI